MGMNKKKSDKLKKYKFQKKKPNNLGTTKIKDKTESKTTKTSTNGNKSNLKNLKQNIEITKDKNSISLDKDNSSTKKENNNPTDIAKQKKKKFVSNKGLDIKRRNT